MADLSNPYNPIRYATFFNNLLKEKHLSLLEASSEHVGLPKGQMGNSEVGHMTIGLGKVVYQDLPRINKMIEDGSLWNTSEVINLLKSDTIHIWGLFSDGGVHAHQDHILSSANHCLSLGKKVHLHIVLDGRDTSPKVAINFLKKIKDHGLIATISGRYYAMDRDNRVDRTNKAVDAIINSRSDYKFDDPIDYIESCYKEGVSDEFIKPSASINYFGVKNSDALWIMNYRQDRVRQFLNLSKDYFEKVLGMSYYGIDIPFVLKKEEKPKGLGYIISKNNMHQLRIAESEKYPHVTYFFNGGIETPFHLEDRITIASPNVATYDLKPEMSSFEITKELINAMNQKKHQLIVTNYAATDMVGHTGNFDAAVKAVRAVDECLLKIYENNNDFEIIITSDHGNIECMKDEFGNPITSHTFSKVPFICNHPVKEYGSLCDVAPTILDLLGINCEMEGNSLLL